jgi:T-complex protein 1 subunit zeta
VSSGFFYKSAEEREKLVSAEREFIEKRVQKVIDLKKKLCDKTDKRFVVINQKVRFCIVCCSDGLSAV